MEASQVKSIYFIEVLLYLLELNNTPTALMQRGKTQPSTRPPVGRGW